MATPAIDARRAFDSVPVQQDREAGLFIGHCLDLHVKKGQQVEILKKRRRL